MRQAGTKRRRMGWLGWSFTAILGIAALLAVLAAWAIRNDAVALLDGVDALRRVRYGRPHRPGGLRLGPAAPDDAARSDHDQREPARPLLSRLRM